MTERGKRVRNFTITGAALVGAFLWVLPSAATAIGAANNHFVTRDELTALKLKLSLDSATAAGQHSGVISAIARLDTTLRTCIKHPPACR